jgi:hypothetical protein
MSSKGTLEQEQICVDSVQQLNTFSTGFEIYNPGTVVFQESTVIFQEISGKQLEEHGDNYVASADIKAASKQLAEVSEGQSKIRS